MKINNLISDIIDINRVTGMEIVLKNRFCKQFEKPMVFEPSNIKDTFTNNSDGFFTIHQPSKEKMLIRFTDI